MDRSHYIRYRIYTNRAQQSGRDYPKRLKKNLINLHKNIRDDQAFWDRDLTNEPILYKSFIPADLSHVNPKYYGLIANITQYFNCYGVWQKMMIKGSIVTINSFTIFGYGQDFKLAYHYITKIINNLNDMRYNIQKEYRRVKINKRRRGIKPEKDNASVKASKFFNTSLDNISNVTKVLLEDNENNRYSPQKLREIENWIRYNWTLDFRSYKYGKKPKIKNAFSRKNKFQNYRIIR